MSDIRVIIDPGEMRRQSRAWRASGDTVGLVPTMGYLHEGHCSLARISSEHCHHTVLSIFVNPTQFGPKEDLGAYPRDLEGDLLKAAAAGAELAFVPETSAVYPPGHQTRVEVAALSGILCGASRPTHFCGVATVVTKLFNMVEPDLAVFGAKDYQQLQVIRRLVADLDFPIRILAGPTVREADGLALSSRNAYLSPSERGQATCLVQGLRAAWRLFDAGVRDASALVDAARAPIRAASLARVDYIGLRDAETLAEIRRVEKRALLALAVHFGRARLIDNTVLGGDQRP